MPRPATPPDLVRDAGVGGAAVHYRALEALYASAPINRLFDSRLEILGEGHARIRFVVDERVHHAAGAAHGTTYFKMLDDAAFYAANSMVSDRFLLTTAFNLHFTKPPVGLQSILARGGRGGNRRQLLVRVRVGAQGSNLGGAIHG